MGRQNWERFARKLDWTLSYVGERDAFPEELAGRPWLPGETRTTRLMVIGKKGLDRIAIAAGLGGAVAALGD